MDMPRTGAIAMPGGASGQTPLLGDLADRLIERVDRAVGLLLREDQRRAQADRVAAGAERQDALGEHAIDDEIALLAGAHLGLAIPDQLDADHQALAADVADQ